MTVAIRVGNLVKEFAMQDGRKQRVLNDICLEVRRGEVVGLAGRNGTGKTTLLRCIAKTVTPDSGAVSTYGTVSLLLDGAKALYRHLSGRENLRYLGALHQTSRLEETIEALCRRLSITYADAPVNTYSRGMMQKVALAAALLASPTVLLLDEPSTALDGEAAEELAFTIKEMAEKDEMAILIASHDRPFLKRSAHRFLHLSEGRLLQAGDDLSGLWEQTVLTLTLDRYHGAPPVPEGVFLDKRGTMVQAAGEVTPTFLRWAAALLEEGSMVIDCSASADQGRGQASEFPQARQSRTATDMVGSSPA